MYKDSTLVAKTQTFYKLKKKTFKAIYGVVCGKGLISWLDNWYESFFQS